MASTLCDWARHSTPLWANDHIKEWNVLFSHIGSIDVEAFVVRESIEERGHLDMRNVVGQEDQFLGRTWLEALLNPQWKPSSTTGCLARLEENPNYYFNGEIKGGMQFSSLDGTTWYTIGEGNHRTVVAKFLCEKIHQESGSYPIVVGVYKRSIDIDTKAMRLFEAMQHFDGISVTVHTLKTSEQMKGNAHITESTLVFGVSDERFGDYRHEKLNRDEFFIYAEGVIANKGIPTLRERSKNFFDYWFCSAELERSLIFRRSKKP